MDQKRPKKVLIAKDEALTRPDLAELPTKGGFEVVGQATDGEEAVKLVRELESDLIIMDVKMPGIDGIIATKVIGGECIALIFMLIVFSQSELVERARDAGVVGYLVRSFGASEVVPAIEVATGRSAELWAIEEESTDLEDRFESRKIIDQAKGMLQEGLGLTEPEAFRRIQETAMDLYKSMREVVEGVISHRQKK